MAWNTIEPGTYEAQATRAAAGVTQSGKGKIEVEFFIPSLNENIRWMGMMTTDKQKARTLKALSILEWTGDIDFPEGSLNYAKTVEIVIGMSEAQDGYESRPQVNWVNEPGSSGMSEMKSDKSGFAGVNFKAEMAKFQKEAGQKKPHAKPVPKPAGKAEMGSTFEPTFDDGESIPF